MRIPTKLLPCSCSKLIIKRSITRQLSTTTKSKLTTTNKSITTNKIQSSLINLKDLLIQYPLLPEWHSRLNSALIDLNQTGRSSRIAVIGTKESGTSQLITASFDEPNVPEISLALASRRLSEEAPEILTLSYGDKIDQGLKELTIPSAWLKEFNVKILEIVYADAPPKESSIDALYSADTIVLMISEEEGCLSPANVRSLLLEFSTKPNFFLVLNSTSTTFSSSSTSIPPTLLHQLQSLFPQSQSSSSSSSTSLPHVNLVSTELALEGLEALNPLDSTISPSVEHFQIKYSNSGLAKLKDLLAESIKNEGAKLETSKFMVEKCLRALTFQAAKIQDDLFKVEIDLAALKFKGEESSKLVLNQLGVTSSSFEPYNNEDNRLVIPISELNESKKLISEVFSNSLQWYKLPFKSDDIITELEPIITKNYLQSFESSLIYKTGLINSLATSMSNETDTLLQSSPLLTPESKTTSPLSSLYSPILMNHIQSAALESTKITSTSLTRPLTLRRSSILSPGGPLEILQLKSQTALLSSFTLGTSSVIVGVAMDFLQYATLSTSIGVASLGFVLALRGLESKWRKARGRFEKDLDERVREGLEVDLGVTTKELINRALFKSNATIVGVESLILKRKIEHGKFVKGLIGIDRDLKEL